MPKAKYTAEEILRQFDWFQESMRGAPPSDPHKLRLWLNDSIAQKNFEQWLNTESPIHFHFPTLNLNIDLGAVRLNAWRDNTRWAIIIEELAFNMSSWGHGGILNSLYWFGNRPPQTIKKSKYNLHTIDPTSDGPESPTFQKIESWSLHPEARTIRIRNRIVKIDLTAKTLRAMKINKVSADGVKLPDATLLLRSLLAEHRDLLLATDDELSAFIPKNLPHFLQLDQWHHPDITFGAIPGESETFQLLARAIAAGDPSLYQPTLPPNTHWKNWVQFGV